MRLGCDLPCFADPGAVRAFAQAAEDIGYDHLDFSEHVATTLDEPLPPRMSRDDPWHECFTTLGFLAAVTSRIELTSSMLLLPLRPAVLAAKQAVEIDLLSGERLRLGVVVGWNAGEARALGVDPSSGAPPASFDPDLDRGRDLRLRRRAHPAGAAAHRAPRRRLQNGRPAGRPLRHGLVRRVYEAVSERLIPAPATADLHHRRPAALTPPRTPGATVTATPPTSTALPGPPAAQPADSQRSFRDVLGLFTTGVVLITATTPDGPVGMAANSFASVSLDPPLVSFGAAHSSTTWPALRAVGRFASSVLGTHHEDLCRVFALRGADRFAGVVWAASPQGHPVVPDGLGWFDCVLEAAHPAGDHELIVARAVGWSEPGAGEPLVFHAGRYARLAVA